MPLLDRSGIATAKKFLVCLLISSIVNVGTIESFPEDCEDWVDCPAAYKTNDLIESTSNCEIC
jgi:hypothetical protein